MPALVLVVAGWSLPLSAMMAATARDVLVVMVARLVTWCPAFPGQDWSHANARVASAGGRGRRRWHGGCYPVRDDLPCAGRKTSRP